jgi:hypothetical protein
MAKVPLVFDCASTILAVIPLMMSRSCSALPAHLEATVMRAATRQAEDDPECLGRKCNWATRASDVPCVASHAKGPMSATPLLVAIETMALLVPRRSVSGSWTSRR